MAAMVQALIKVLRLMTLYNVIIMKWVLFLAQLVSNRFSLKGWFECLGACKMGIMPQILGHFE